MRARSAATHDRLYVSWSHCCLGLAGLPLRICARILRLMRRKPWRIAILCAVLIIFSTLYVAYKIEPLETSSMQETTFYWGPRGLLLSPAFRKAQTDPNRKVDIFVFKGTEFRAFAEFIQRPDKDFVRPYVVVSAGSDLTIPNEFFLPRLPGKCLTWFSTNVDLHVSPQFAGRIKPLPIGLDFDGKTRTSHGFVEGFGWKSLLRPWTLVEFPVSPQVQEAELLELIATLPNTLERKSQVYADFWVNKGYGRTFPDHRKGPTAMSITRKEAYETVKQNPNVVLSRYRLPRVEAWWAKGQYMFELSIPGNGMDCYRTWEALVLGIIVITVSSPLNSLFTGLPVVILDDLGDVTEANLLKWKHEYGSRFADPMVRARLTNQYWVDHILAEVKKHSEPL